MNLQLLTRDPGIRGLWLRVPVALTIATIIRLMTGDMSDILGRQPFTQGPYYSVVYPSLLLGFMVFVIAANAWTRQGRLTAGLPIPAREAWTARMAAIAAGVLVPLTLFTLVVSIAGEPGEFALSSAGLTLGLQSGCVILLVLALLQAPSPTLRRADATWGYSWYAVLVVVTSVFYVAIVPVGLLFWLVPLLIAAIFLYRTYTNLPESFLEQGRWLDPAPAPTAMPGTLEADLDRQAAPAPGRARTLRALTRALHGGWNTPAAVIPSAITLAAVGGYTFIAAVRYRDGDWMWWMVFSVVLFFWSYVGQLTGRVCRIDHLPVSRRTLFALIVVPAIVLLAIGLAIGSFVPDVDPTPDPVTDCDGPGVAVAQESWELARAGEVSVIEAPSGETHAPGSCELWRDSAWVVYNPYSAGADSSDEFVEWQQGRAADSDARSRTTALMVLVAVATLGLLSLATFRRARPYPTGRVTFVLALATVVLGILGALLTVLAEVFEWTTGWALSVLATVPLRMLADALPLPTWLLWALVPVAGAGCYVLVQRAFYRIEGRSAASKATFVDEL